MNVVAQPKNRKSKTRKGFKNNLELIYNILLVVATFMLVTTACLQLIISIAQTNLAREFNSIAESQKEIMKTNLDLIKPKINCWWTIIKSKKGNIINISVVNSGQIPILIDNVTVRPPKKVTVVVGEKSSVTVEENKTTCLTPATIILGGEVKWIECNTTQSNISAVKVENTFCKVFNRSITVTESGPLD